jgi:outer membrane protein OmpA-like peptidoglycan-associated protein
MDDRQALPARNSSRTLAMIAVAVLVVIAIAGIVAGVRSRASPDTAAAAPDATHARAPGMTPVDPALAAAETAAGPNAVVFAPESDEISDTSEAKLERIAGTAKKNKPMVVIAGHVEARPDRVEQMALAQKRVIAVRSALEQHGVPLGTIRVEIAEMPLGTVPASEANRVDVALR